MKSALKRYAWLCLLALPLLPAPVLAPVALAQSESQARAPYSQQELDDMLAPIALYPDPLLSQILMASTYPLEVVEAARWSRAHRGLQGDPAVRAVADSDWDPSVKSLVAFPQVLAMMNDKLDWTEDLGDAFLGQEQQVMDTVQSLRQRAYAAGNLRSSEQVRVVADGGMIEVDYASPGVVYVPYYDPLVVYGAWWWPNSRPVYWAPWPGYHVRPGYAGFVWGGGIGISAGFFFGAFDWPHRHVNVVKVNNYYYRNSVVVNRTPGVWQHDPGHRRGAPYRQASLRERFAHAAPPAQMRGDSRRPEAPAASSKPAPRPEARMERAGPERERPRAEPPVSANRPSAPAESRREHVEPPREHPRAEPPVVTRPSAPAESRRERTEPPHDRTVMRAEPPARAPEARHEVPHPPPQASAPAPHVAASPAPPAGKPAARPAPEKKGGGEEHEKK